jgi:hypothetical protein
MVKLRKRRVDREAVLENVLVLVVVQGHAIVDQSPGNETVVQGPGKKDHGLGVEADLEIEGDGLGRGRGLNQEIIRVGRAKRARDPARTKM